MVGRDDNPDLLHEPRKSTFNRSMRRPPRSGEVSDGSRSGEAGSRDPQVARGAGPAGPTDKPQES